MIKITDNIGLNGRRKDQGMQSRLKLAGILTVCILLLASALSAGEYLENLKPDEHVNGFTAKAVYENASGDATGARFIHEKQGFIIDVMQIQSVPQAFYWIKTTPTSSMGEPHACEHLLLGKGNRGRYVAALEDMSLGQSTAYTQQIRTCYHFNTVAGIDVFYNLFEAKLMAFLHPDFTDEEIRREVCHIGVTKNPQNDSLYLDEKGTVYTEMVSSFERPWYHTWKELNYMVYGKDHPLTYVSGGDPDVMRKMVPEDMWKFIKNSYYLGNMGAIVSIPPDIDIESFLGKMDDILNRCQEVPRKSGLVGISAYDFPPVHPAPIGEKRMVTYPSNSQEDPGYILMAWPILEGLSQNDRFMLNQFLSTFASGQTSNLYKLFINSETKKIDIGGEHIYAGLDDDIGVSVYLGLTGVDTRFIEEPILDSVKNLLFGELTEVASYEPDSDELKAFNARVNNQLIASKKQIENYLNSPPMFGFRSGPAGGWLNFMRSLEEENSFRKSLTLNSHFAFADSMLSLNKNIWADYIVQWKLKSLEPYMVGAIPSAEYLVKNTQSKHERLENYTEEFMKKYGTDDPQTALADYKEDFDQNTAKLDQIAAGQKLPDFIDNPPMTLDDNLDYETIELYGGVPMMASTFENMTASRIGLALDLNVIPESLMVYVPYLTTLLTDIGVIDNGTAVPYDDMQERLRREVLDFNAYFSFGYQTERAELVLSAEGSDTEELMNAIDWMDLALNHPYLNQENLSRMNDLIDQSIISHRNRTKGSEESWVDNPANAYRFQHNPIYLSTRSFMTQTHQLNRLKWQLTDPGSDADQKQLSDFLDALKDFGAGKTREEKLGLLDLIEGIDNIDKQSFVYDLKTNPLDFKDKARGIAKEIATSMKSTLPEIPDENLDGDWAYLCDEIKGDLMMLPENSIGHINAVLDLLRRQGNARLFMISNSADRKKALSEIRDLVKTLDSTPAPRQEYASDERIMERMKSRNPNLTDPTYVGLVHEGTRNGVMLFSAKVADSYDTTTDAVLNCLSGKLFGGGGPHGLFMKTWGAGLAYSNGYGYRQSSGRVSYYAERCPDVSETMRFVVKTLKTAEPDPSLQNYAIAQVFGASRAPNRYEARGESMAENLVDGMTPDKVRAFRQKVLDLRSDAQLFDKIWSRMEQAYGPVLIGYGEPLEESKNGNFFLIGPPQQFESLQNYIKTAEEESPVYKLYPRDFWMTGAGS